MAWSETLNVTNCSVYYGISISTIGWPALSVNASLFLQRNTEYSANTPLVSPNTISTKVSMLFQAAVAALNQKQRCPWGCATQMARRWWTFQAGTGCFCNLLHLRMITLLSAAFSADFKNVEESIRQVIAHATVSLDLISVRVVSNAAPPAEMRRPPLFQAVFDYRQGAAESGTIVGASIFEVLASRERTPMMLCWKFVIMHQGCVGV